MSDGIDVAGTQVAGSLSLDGVSMHRPAFAVLDVTPLWEVKQRGADQLIPGADGHQPIPRMIDSLNVQLRMMFDGRFNPDGTLRTSSAIEGLWSLDRWLRANVTDPAATADGTRLASLTSPDGLTTTTAPVTVLGMTPGAIVGHLRRVTLDLIVQPGQFT